jgi:hypothetical protein
VTVKRRTQLWMRLVEEVSTVLYGGAVTPGATRRSDPQNDSEESHMAQMLKWAPRHPSLPPVLYWHEAICPYCAGALTGRTTEEALRRMERHIASVCLARPKGAA